MTGPSPGDDRRFRLSGPVQAVAFRAIGPALLASILRFRIRIVRCPGPGRIAIALVFRHELPRLRIPRRDVSTVGFRRFSRITAVRVVAGHVLVSLPCPTRLPCVSPRLVAAVGHGMGGLAVVPFDCVGTGVVRRVVDLVHDDLPAMWCADTYIYRVNLLKRRDEFSPAARIVSSSMTGTATTAFAATVP